jgi:hypothetical protein
MGFPDDQIVQALRATRNNQQAACAWLLGDRTVTISGGGGGVVGDDEDDEDGDEEDDDDDGSYMLSGDDRQLVQQILSDQTIRNHLTANPNAVDAIRAVMNNAAAAEDYMHDPAVAPILVRVGQILMQSRQRAGAGGTTTTTNPTNPTNQQ